MDDNSTRRLVRLKRHSTLQDRNDDDLELALEDALSFFLEYTRQEKDLGPVIDGLICDIAVFRLNQEGVENVKVAREGEVEREFYEGTPPPMLVPRLNRYRLIPGL